MIGKKGRSGGPGRGGGRPRHYPASAGKRINIYLDGDLIEPYKAIPDGQKSKFINDAIREKLELDKQGFGSPEKGGQND